MIDPRINSVEIVQSPLQYRADLALLCKEKNLTDCVEIGVHQGVFAKNFLSKNTSLRLLLVDPYVGYDGKYPTYYPHVDGSTKTREQDYQIALNHLAEYSDRIRFERRFSHDVARTQQPGSFDFVYVDGAHTYLDVLQDVFLWWPLIKDGGILAGHDFHKILPEVMQAVRTFAYVQSKSIYLISDKRDVDSWYILK